MRVTRTEWIDVFVEGDEAAVFVGGQVSVLSPLATALLGLVDDGVELSVLVTGLVDAFGAPDGDPVAITRETVAELVSLGILAVDPSDGCSLS